MRSASELGLGPLELPTSMRASMDGAVPEDTKYDDWIKQEDVQKKLQAFKRERAKKYYQQRKKALVKAG